MESITSLYKIGYGPSSSHTMGPQKATALFLAEHAEIKKLQVTLYGSLALTGIGHLTDYIIEQTAAPIPVEFIWEIKEEEHPNTLDFIGYDENNQEIASARVYSIGGGDIRFAGNDVAQEKQVYPHHTFTAIANYCQTHQLSLLAYINRFDQHIDAYLHEVWQTMQQAISAGVAKTGELSGGLEVKRKAKALYDAGDETVHLLAYAYAVNEENAGATTMVVTAPTCGACGTLPAVLRFAQEQHGYHDDKIIDALKIAGLIGLIIRTNASISGAVAGCQAEVGSATSMAAAALAFLNDAPLEIIESAAEIAMEHQLGLTCDPVAGLVQIPCIQRNAIAAQKAYTAYNIAKTLGASETVSFDTIVDVMYETGKAMPHAYRETSIGGIAVHYKNKQSN